MPRALLLPCLLLVMLAVQARPRLLINEVAPAPMFTAADTAFDWLELFNPGHTPVDLQGMRLVLGDQQHSFTGPLALPAKGHLVLRAMGRQASALQELTFKLPRTGGTLLLVDRDGITVLDIFTWPAMGPGTSMGRLPDGSRTWSFFQVPTPGFANTGNAPITAFTERPTAWPPPGDHGDTVRLSLSADHGATVYYTLDGSPPDPAHAHRFTAPITLARNTVVRARAHAPDRMPGPELLAQYTFGTGPRHKLSLCLDPADLWDAERGINVPGANTNHTRSGRAWERPALLALPGDVPAMGVGVRVAGSGTRGLAKRSFKLYARSGHGSPVEGIPAPDGHTYREVLLRADASPHAFLRHRLMETVVRRHRLQLDMQPSEPVDLYLNGDYWGLYRLTTPKDAQWLKRVDGAKAVDILAGPAATVHTGDDQHYRKAMERLHAGDPLTTVDSLIDLRSLIDLACADLYMGRADHDLNMRCHRPRRPGGRWRWVLYDVDLWAPATDNSVVRMCSSQGAEAPFLFSLLAHEELRLQLLARLTALQAVAFAPSGMHALLDSLHDAHAEELLADHRRWELALDVPHPERSLVEIHAFIDQRPGHLMRQLAAYTGLKLRTMEIEVPAAELGHMLLEGLPLPPGTHRIMAFAGVPLDLEAIPAPGHELAGWKGCPADGAEASVDVANSRTVKALYRPTGQAWMR